MFISVSEPVYNPVYSDEIHIIAVTLLSKTINKVARQFYWLILGLTLIVCIVFYFIYIDCKIMYYLRRYLRVPQPATMVSSSSI